MGKRPGPSINLYEVHGKSRGPKKNQMGEEDEGEERVPKSLVSAEE